MITPAALSAQKSRVHQGVSNSLTIDEKPGLGSVRFRFHGILDDDMSTSLGPGLNSYVNVGQLRRLHGRKQHVQRHRSSSWDSCPAGSPATVSPATTSTTTVAAATHPPTSRSGARLCTSCTLQAIAFLNAIARSVHSGAAIGRTQAPVRSRRHDCMAGSEKLTDVPLPTAAIAPLSSRTVLERRAGIQGRLPPSMLRRPR